MNLAEVHDCFTVMGAIGTERIGRAEPGRGSGTARANGQRRQVNMQLSVATNFDDELIRRAKDYPVSELFGKLSSDFVGGGRPTFYLPPISRSRFEQHIRLARSLGIGFNYLLNAACLDNLEFTRTGQRAIERTLGPFAK